MKKSAHSKPPVVQITSDQSDIAKVEHGFLSIETNWFDRIFISIVIWVAISLFWFRFLEPLNLSIWFSNIISLILAIVVVKKG